MDQACEKSGVRSRGATDMHDETERAARGANAIAAFKRAIAEREMAKRHLSALAPAHRASHDAHGAANGALQWRGMNMSSPLDELAVQLPGRALATEIVVTLLLRQRADAAEILAQAEVILSEYETHILADPETTRPEYALEMFAAGREQLDGYARNAVPASDGERNI